MGAKYVKSYNLEQSRSKPGSIARKIRKKQKPKLGTSWL